MLTKGIIKKIQGFCRPAVENGLIAEEDFREAAKILQMEIDKGDAGAERQLDRLLRTKDVAQIFGVHSKTVLRMAGREELEKIYLSPGNPKSLRFRESDIQKLIAGGAE